MVTRQADSQRRLRAGVHMPTVTATPHIIAMLVEDGFLHPDLIKNGDAIGKAIEDCLEYYASQPPER